MDVASGVDCKGSLKVFPSDSRRNPSQELNSSILVDLNHIKINHKRRKETKDRLYLYKTAHKTTQLSICDSSIGKFYRQEIIIPKPANKEKTEIFSNRYFKIKQTLKNQHIGFQLQVLRLKSQRGIKNLTSSVPKGFSLF